MPIKIPQNFYRQTISQDWPTGTGNFYITVKPTVSTGYMTISPASTSLREIVYFSGTGTDGTGDYVTISSASDRGLGGTTEQTHIIGEPVRMNVGAETIQDISDDIAAIIAAGAPPATATTTGLVYLPVIETTVGATHSLTTVANEKVVVWAKGVVVQANGGTPADVLLKYNGVTKDTTSVTAEAAGNSTQLAFTCMYTEVPGAGTHDITVTCSGYTLSQVSIIVLKIRTP